MTLIADLINFYASMGNQVRLHDHYYDETENQGRMAGYMPIRAHREAFLSLARAQLPDRANKDKVFMLTGSFGTGKSHLCLMLANYFSQKVSAREMQPFFDNWAKRDPAGSSQVRNMRGEGRYLVAICEFGTGRQFEDMILSAIEEALEKEGAAEVTFNNYFKGILRQIEEWQARRESGERAGVFEDFLYLLNPDDPDTALDDLKKQLGNNDSLALERFQDTYQKAAGQRFNLRTDNLVAVLADLLNGQEFRNRYRGLVILADEFGYALREGRVKMSVFQGFAEMSKDGVNGLPIIFIGTGHMRFAAYSESIPADKIDFRVVSDRVTEVSLQSEELEQIIAALISPKTEEAAWKQEIQSHWLLTKMANETKRSDTRKVKLFDYLSEPELLDQVVRNIYPMHPLAVYCLTRLSQELGSDARSVFSFFRKGPVLVEGSYPWYVSNTDIKKPNGDLNIYTSEMLVQYFAESIQSSNLSVRPEVHDQIRNYLAAVDSAQQLARSTFSGEVNPFTQRVLDQIFVLRVSGVPVNFANLQFGLNLFRPEEQKQLEGELKTLRDSKIIFQGTGGEFELRRSNMADIDAMVGQIREVIAQRPLDAAEKISRLADKYWELWTVATGHNINYYGDKRMRRVFATPNDLLRKTELPDGSQLPFWQKLERERAAQKSWNERYDGTMVYVLCETADDILVAQQAVRSNNVPTLIVGVPSSPMPVKDAILNLLAIDEFKTTLDYNKLDPQEKSLVAEMYGKETQRQGRVGEVIKARDRYLQAKDLVWYQVDGKVLLNNPSSDYEPADAIMTALFKKRNFAEHTYLNLAHPKTFAGTRDNALREAVARLVAFDRPVEIDSTEKESQGEIRYLKSVLVNNNILLQTGDYSGSSALYQLNTNLDAFRNKFPALVETVEMLRGIERGEKLTIWPRLSGLTEAPYGLGPFALCLFLAVAIRYLGDELRLKLNPTQLGYSPVDDADIVIDLASGKYPNAAVERRDRTAATIELIDGIYGLFSEVPTPAGTHNSLHESWQAMLAWWRKRSRLEKTGGIYPEGSSAQKLVNMLASFENVIGASQSFLDEVKQVYGYSMDAELDLTQVKEVLDRLMKDRSLLETHVESIKGSLVDSIGHLFAPEGKTYMDYAEAIRAWVNGLHPDQLDLHASWQDKSSTTLLEALPKITDVERMLLAEIPAGPGFGFGKVDDWSYDRSQDYLKRFDDALQRINDSLPKVPAPEWETPIKPGQNNMGEPVVQFYGSVKLVVKAPEGVVVRVARDADPKTATQFEPVAGGTSWSCEVTESTPISMVSRTAQGEFSKVLKIYFRNLNDQYRLESERQPSLKIDERYYTFRNPTTPEALQTLMNDLLQHLEHDNILTPEQILTAITEALRVKFKKGGN